MWKIFKNIPWKYCQSNKTLWTMGCAPPLPLPPPCINTTINILTPNNIVHPSLAFINIWPSSHVSDTNPAYSHPWLTTYPHPRTHPSNIHQHMFIHPPRSSIQERGSKGFGAVENPGQGIREDEEERRWGRGASSRMGKRTTSEGQESQKQNASFASLASSPCHAMPCPSLASIAC